MTAQAHSLAQQAQQACQNESIPLYVAGGETVQMGSSSQGYYSDEQHSDGEYYEETVHDNEEVTL